jgi:hypothetical protein
MHSKVEWAWYILCKIPFGLENGEKLWFLHCKRRKGLIGFQNFGTFFNLGTSNHGRGGSKDLRPFSRT